MYHVTTDNAFPYRVCRGQQDSGIACVQSRSDDGRITFHDWHPVNIQEYGMAAPDPKDPDIVYGSPRNGVSRYDRRTAQTTQVGPDTSGTLPGGGAMNRNVRTMPLDLSPVDELTLYLRVERRVEERSTTATRGRASAATSRARRGPCRPTPASTRARVKPAPMGSITALAP